MNKKFERETSSAWGSPDKRNLFRQRGNKTARMSRVLTTNPFSCYWDSMKRRLQYERETDTHCLKVKSIRESNTHTQLNFLF